MNRVVALITTIAFCLLAGAEARAQWSADPTANNPICTAARDQTFPRMVSDGAGGAIITWEDFRNDPLFTDVYVQRINAAGAIQWSADGVAVGVFPDDQSDQEIASDDSGGAIVAWNDRRNGSYYRVFAQRFGPEGTPLWPAGGALACTTIASQLTPSLINDGAGGAIVTWVDNRVLPASGTEIYAQHIDWSGNRQWGNAAASVCSVRNDQVNPQIVSDGEGGAYIVWEDRRILSNRDIYIQRLTSMGIRQWSDTGLAVCRAAGEQRAVRMVPDGFGGVIIVWEDLRNGATNIDIYAQRVGKSGARWQADGVPICTNVTNQSTPALATHSLGGATIVWQDNRFQASGDIFAQSIDTSGQIRWAVDGIVICDANQGQTVPQIVADAGGNQFITWADGRLGGGDVFAQRINAAGVVQWTVNGVPISTEASSQNNPRVAPNNAGGAIIAWEDLRNNLTSRIDIYAARVNSSGTLTSVADTESPHSFGLHQNYPNPFNPTTAISYQLSAVSHVTLKVYDLLGREVAMLVNEVKQPGHYEVTWEASGLASGMYFYRLTSGGISQTKKLALTR